MFFLHLRFGPQSCKASLCRPLAVVTMFGNATGLPLALMPVILASAPYVGSQAGAALCVMLYGILNKVRGP